MRQRFAFWQQMDLTSSFHGGKVVADRLSMHTGEAKAARSFAAVNLDLFPQDLVAIITNAAGCGSGMKEYELLFRGHRLEEKATAIFRSSSRHQSVSEFD